MFSKNTVAANPQYTNDLKPNLDKASIFAEAVLYTKVESV